MLLKVKILLISILFIFIIAGTYFAFVRTHKSKVYSQPHEVVALGNPACDGSENPYFDSGFGVEHEYQGEIASGQKVTVILSCDHTKLTITGVVNQVISSALLAKDPTAIIYHDIMSDNGAKTSFEGTEELADLVAGTEVVSVREDYNFDGYNDLVTVASAGQGSEAINSYFIFLYDPVAKQFKFNANLSGYENIYLDEHASTTKEIGQLFNFNEDGRDISVYKWTASGKLYKAKHDNCESNRQLIGDGGNTIKYYIRHITSYNESGKIISQSEKKLTPRDAQSVCTTE